MFCNAPSKSKPRPPSCKMKFKAQIKIDRKRGSTDSGMFASKQAAIDWARDRGAYHLTVIESLTGDAKRVVYSGRLG